MLTFYHAPLSRSFRILWLLEELGEPYEMKIVNIRRQDGSGGADESYRAVNPHLKVPSIVHDGQTVLESSAICIYLADAFPNAGLGPRVGEPSRAAYLSWLVYCAAAFEPSMAGTAQKWENMRVAIPLLDEVLRHVEGTLSSTPYIAGDRFTAADIMVTSILQYGIYVMKIIPTSTTFEDYLARCSARPAFGRARAKDSGVAT